MLDQFIDRDFHHKFWAMLANSGSAISHELPLLLLLYCPNIPPTTEPICNLTSPAGKGGELATLLLALGFILVDKPPSDWCVEIESSPEPRMYLAKTDTTVHLAFLLTWGGWSSRLKDWYKRQKTVWICIKQSTSDNIWESLLAETTTGGMSVITPGFVFEFSVLNLKTNPSMQIYCHCGMLNYRARHLWPLKRHTLTLSSQIYPGTFGFVVPWSYGTPYECPEQLFPVPQLCSPFAVPISCPTILTSMWASSTTSMCFEKF